MLIFREVITQCKEEVSRIHDNILTVEIVIDVIGIPSREDGDREIGEFWLHEYLSEDIFEFHSRVESVSSSLEILDFRCEILDPKFVLPLSYLELEIRLECIDRCTFIESIRSDWDNRRAYSDNTLIEEKK